MLYVILVVLLFFTVSTASAQQGPGLWQAAPGTQISQCTNIGSPVANRTWCADGNNNPLYRWRVWDGTQYIAVGGDGGGVCGFSGQVTIADSATTALVTFGVPQATADYFVVVSTVPVSGTPLGVFAWAHDQTINGFTVEISGPPLVGNVIGVNWQVSSGSCGGTGPSLPDTSVQFNNAGSFGGDSNLLWNNTLKRLQIGSLPLGTLAPGPLVVGSVAASGTAQQAGLFQIISGTSVGAGPVTLSQDNVAVSGWSFAGADSVNAPYGGNFGVHFLGPGQARGVEIDVQNEFGDAGIGAFGQHIGLWLNRSGTYNASSAISIASQDPRGWWYGLHFAPGNAGTGTDTLIKGWGIYYFRAMPNQMIGIVPSDDNNPDDAMITVFAFDGTTEKSKLDKRGRFYSRGDDTGVTQPAFTFIDEPNTGIYMPAAGQLGLAVTGTEVFKAVTTPVTGTLTHGYITSFGTVFASLGAVINGAIIYCSDCAQTVPCTGGGTGAFAQGINAAWSCTSGAAVGGGGITGGGTTNTVVKFTAATAIGDSRITDDATTITATTDLLNVGNNNTGMTTGASPSSRFVIGTFNDVANSNQTFRFGDSNTGSGDQTLSLGLSNVNNCNGSSVVGQNNTCTAGGSLNSVFGESNTMGTVSNSVVVGYLLNMQHSDAAAFGQGGTITGNGGLFVGSGKVGGLGVGATVSGASASLFGNSGGIVTVSGDYSMGFVMNDFAGTDPARILSGHNSVLFWLDGPAFTLSDNNAFAIKGGDFQLRPKTTTAGATAEARWYELAANGTNYVGFKAADTLAGNVIWTLPIADGTSGQALTTNGSAVLSWGGTARRVCAMIVGADNGSVLVDADLGPQGRQCFIPAAATVVEVNVAGDAGTPNIIPRKNSAGSGSNLVSSALATAAAGGIACSNTGGTTGLNGVTTCSATLQNTSLAAGDYIELISGTAGGVAKRMSVFVIYTIN